MTAPIPTVEPQELRAGYTWQWRREDLAADYPATAWTLKYALKNASQHLEITASADGPNFAVSVPIATTGPVAAGVYRMVGYVEDAGAVNRFEIYNEEVLIEASYANASPVDDRSHSRKVLEAIEAVLENRATKDQEEYHIGNRMLKRTPLMELYKFKQEYEGKVRSEDQMERAERGQGGNKIVVKL